MALGQDEWILGESMAITRVVIPTSLRVEMALDCQKSNCDSWLSDISERFCISACSTERAVGEEQRND